MHSCYEPRSRLSHHALLGEVAATALPDPLWEDLEMRWFSWGKSCCSARPWVCPDFPGVSGLGKEAAGRHGYRREVKEHPHAHCASSTSGFLPQSLT